MREISQRILAYLNNSGPARVRQLAEELRIDRRVVEAAVRDLMVAGRVWRSKSRRYYTKDLPGVPKGA